MGKQKTEARTHDYTRPRWGHDYTINEIKRDGQKLQATGWGRDIGKGDTLVLRHPQGGAVLYRVRRIRYFRDPSDMWTATLRFQPLDVTQSAT